MKKRLLVTIGMLFASLTSLHASCESNCAILAATSKTQCVLAVGVRVGTAVRLIVSGTQTIDDYLADTGDFYDKCKELADEQFNTCLDVCITAKELAKEQNSIKEISVDTYAEYFDSDGSVIANYSDGLEGFFTPEGSYDGTIWE